MCLIVIKIDCDRASPSNSIVLLAFLTKTNPQEHEQNGNMWMQYLFVYSYFSIPLLYYCSADLSRQQTNTLLHSYSVRMICLCWKKQTNTRAKIILSINNKYLGTTNAQTHMSRCGSTPHTN